MGTLIRMAKLQELNVFETLEFETRLKHASELADEHRRISLEMEETSLSLRKLWLVVRKKYKIKTENVTYDDGAVYEGRIEN